MEHFSNDPNYEIWGNIMVFSSKFNTPLSNQMYMDMSFVHTIVFNNTFNQFINWKKIPSTIKIIDFGNSFNQVIKTIPTSILLIILPENYIIQQELPAGPFSLKNCDGQIVCAAIK